MFSNSTQREKLTRAAEIRCMEILRAAGLPNLLNYSQITENIYMSNFELSLDVERLASNGISYVLYIGRRQKSREVIALYKNSGIVAYQLALDDLLAAPLGRILSTAYSFIKHAVENRAKVLVHCDMGVSRSTSVLIYYYVRRYYLGTFLHKADITHKMLTGPLIVPKVLAHIKEMRPCVSPNRGFISCLIECEHAIRQELLDRVELLWKDWLGGKVPEAKVDLSRKIQNIMGVTEEIEQKFVVAKPDREYKLDSLDDL